MPPAAAAVAPNLAPRSAASRSAASRPTAAVVSVAPDPVPVSAAVAADPRGAAAGGRGGVAITRVGVTGAGVTSRGAREAHLGHPRVDEPRRRQVAARQVAARQVAAGQGARGQPAGGQAWVGGAGLLQAVAVVQGAGGRGVTRLFLIRHSLVVVGVAAAVRPLRSERAPVCGAFGERVVLAVPVGVGAGVAVGAVVAVAVGELLGSGLGRCHGAVLGGLSGLGRRTFVSLGVGCLRRSPLRQPRWWLHAVIHAVLLGKLLRRAYPATLPAQAYVPTLYFIDALPPRSVANIDEPTRQTAPYPPTMRPRPRPRRQGPLPPWPRPR